MPLCSLLQEEVKNAPSGDFRFLEFSMLIGEQNEMRTF